MKNTITLTLDCDNNYLDTIEIIKKTCNKNKIEYDDKMINKVYFIFYLINLISIHMDKKIHTDIYDKFFFKYKSDNINIFKVVSLLLKKYKKVGCYKSSSGIDCRCNICIDNDINCFNSFFIVCNRKDDNGRYYRISSNQKIELKKIKINKNIEVKLIHEYNAKERMITF